MPQTRSVVNLIGAFLFLANAVFGTCPATNQPGATVLFPYFEVDLDDPTGIDTLVSVNNANVRPVLANLVVWSDWGIPVLAFNLYLTAERVQPISLRSLLKDGVLPTTGSGTGTIAGAPACADPLSLPILDEAARAALRAQLTGQPHPDDGLCYGSGAGGPASAVGYITVDTINDCTTDIRFPIEPGYFDFDGTGFASNDNVLWGDFFLVERGQDAAQGFSALGLVATTGQPPGGRTFYTSFTPPFDGRDQRARLGTRRRARFVTGAGFDGGTEVLVWTEGYAGTIEPVACGSSPITSFESAIHVLRFTNEAGDAAGVGISHTARRAARHPLGTAPFEPETPFGSASIETLIKDPFSGVPIPNIRAQNWAGTVVRALGRLSVATESACTEVD